MEFRQLWVVGVFFYLDILCPKSHENGFGCYEAENGMHSGSKEVEPMFNEGLSMDNPRTVLGLLKSLD